MSPSEAHSSETLIEFGVGETRAILLDASGAIAEAHVERATDGWRCGDVREVRLATILVPGVRGIVTANGHEALLEPLPRYLTEGITTRVEIVRAAVPEAGRPRLAKAVATTDAVRDGKTLAERLAARKLAVKTLAAHQPDAFEAAGWSELVETAMTGHVPFPGGSLTISPTPAMTVIDIDGALPPIELANAAAAALASVIRRFGLAGSIGIDFPTVGDKAARARIGELVDAGFAQAGIARFERTAVNGFGFMQIILPRDRPSLVERMRGDPVQTAALRLLRQAERSIGTGARTLVAAPVVIAWFTANPALTVELERRLGVSIVLQGAPSLAISAGHVAVRP